MNRCGEGILTEAISQDECKRLSEFLKVFSDPDRIRIMSLLNGREVCVGLLAQSLGKSISAVSHQLSIMRQKRLVRYIKDGRNIYYTLDDGHIAVLLEAAKEHVEHK